MTYRDSQSNLGFHSSVNRSITPLAGDETFTGVWERCEYFASAIASVKADTAGTLIIDFGSLDSTGEVTAQSSLSYAVPAGINQVHRLTVTRPFVRVRYVNGSSAQTTFDLNLLLGSGGILTAPLNLPINQYSDAIVARIVNPDIDIAAGRFGGISIVPKLGENIDVDSGTLPEDIWDGGGVYTGFPTGSPEEIQVFSSSASDTGTLTFTYLASSTSTSYSSASVTLQGTTQVNTGVTAWRVHTARYNSGAATTFNVGTVTIRHRTTTANVFQTMLPGKSQTYSSGYTVPEGSSGYIQRIKAGLLGGANTNVNGALWIRTNGDGPRLRRPFAVASNSYVEEIFGGIRVNGPADVIVRITATSGSNLDVEAGYDLVLVSDL